ncbi:leucine-rich repeat domain-containing protein [Paenibacillus sp. FSL W8-0426]|uniref:leucine-rich repeat domain-containing protein n=1 Tax=Paenibacillus sp. FSL W8-0426 TaxID=2921714 RepID=UPI0030DC61A0
MIPFHTDPRNEAYEQLIDELIKRTDRFMLVDRGYYDEMPLRVSEVLSKLEPYLIEKCSMEELMLRSGAMYTEGTYYIFRCTPESGQILKQEARRFKDWFYPDLPDDLCFLQKDGSDYFFSVAHEDMFGMRISEEEAIQLMERIPGLFFRLKRHEELDRLLDDAIRNQTDRLEISSMGIQAIPDRIRELKALKSLEIVERDLFTLPKALFELASLEELSIMTGDLESLPANIRRLKKLKHLTIYCGTSFIQDSDWKPKPKQDIALDRIPPEIGELSQLESLHIAYTAIKELPPELEKLAKLKYLNISNSLIESVPDVIERMPWLKSIHLSSAEWSWKNVLDTYF